MGHRAEHRHRGRQRVDKGALPRVARPQAIWRRGHRHSAGGAPRRMSQGIRRPYEAADMDAIQRLYPPPPEYFETVFYEDREKIEAKQLNRLKEKAWRAYRIPFHRERWD